MKTKLLFIAITLVTYFGAKAQTTHNVSITSNFSFSPAQITISEGDIVRWTNNSSMGHTSTSGTNCTNDGHWNSGTIASQQSFTHTFTDEGTFEYFCIPHCPGMEGSVIVTGVTSTKKDVSVASNMKSFPNPFTSSSTLEFSLSKPGSVKVEVYDMVGKKISETAETTMTAGSQSVKLDGETLLEGMYICKIIFDGAPAASHYVVKGQE